MHDPNELTGTVTGLLLAGGRGVRAGLDKRYFVLEGRTLLRRNLDFLRRHFARVVVSLAEGQTTDFGDSGELEILRDAWPVGSPLAGIATALERLRQPVFAMAADLARPDEASLRRVLGAAPSADVALPVAAGHYEPLFAVYDPACLPAMSELLRVGDHRIVAVLPRLRVAEVGFADESPFLNINTLADFERAQPVGGGMARPMVDPALVAIVARSGSGKTTFIEKLLPELAKLGVRVGTVKHDAHRFEIDHPGKDSWRHGQAGALAYVVASDDTLAYVAKLDGAVPLSDIARRFFAGFDLVVAEGYRRSAPHCIELFRAGAGHDGPLCASGEAIAVVTDAPLTHEHVFGLEDAAAVARFLAVRLDTLRRY